RWLKVKQIGRNSASFRVTRTSSIRSRAAMSRCSTTLPSACSIAPLSDGQSVGIKSIA
ncbi:hypothetical protein RB213_005656, partial [Colletotrichum asianum]